MDYYDVIEKLVDEKKASPSEKDYLHMYKEALKMLNSIKLSRYKAMFFGSMQIGTPEMFEWKNVKEFTKKYQAVCIHVMSSLYDNIENKKILAETTLSMLYSILSKYFDNKEVDAEVTKLLNENDAFCNDKDLEGEFNG